MKSARLCLCASLLILLFTVTSAPAGVRMWEKDIVIPTYLAGPPEPNPMFYFGRQSQGAQGRVYPYPLYDSLTDIKSNKSYRIVYLENEYIRIGILPEIGGRLFEAVDKGNGYDFVYRQHVIKPALIGIIGAWISGGIEWNIPHHHRATTFLPVQYRLEVNADGSKTCWVGELELRHRTRWAVGYTLRPGRSYLECSVRIVNRTPYPNTMLCFANVAVHVDETYQVIYPPRTQLVTFHSKNDFTTWPIATTRYAGIDFSRGVDVSWFSNHLAATSMFAWNYEDDFFAGYDHGKQAGTMSVANHHIVPGKKFWTWGSGPRGRMWDKILTDNDGPYIELMVGGYSDNQPDYSWLQPFETKSFEMYWYPFRDIGGVKEANLNAAVNLDITNGVIRAGFCSTSSRRDATVRITAAGTVLLEQNISIDPAKPFITTVPLPAGIDVHSVRAALFAEGTELVGYSPVRLGPVKMPAPVKPPPAPGEFKTAEELLLAGQRIEQFHAPGRDPEPYWEEALRRDPDAVEPNLALGIRRLKQARYADAEQHLRRALHRLTENYTTPRTGEPFYYLGIALDRRGRAEEARNVFFKATWSEAWRSPGYYALAELASRERKFASALDCVERALDANAFNIRAATLKAAILRHTGRKKEARAALDEIERKVDPLDARIMAERWLLGGNDRELARTLVSFPSVAVEVAAEYAGAGLWSDGDAVLELAARAGGSRSEPSPMVDYYRAWFAEMRGEPDDAARFRGKAESRSPEYVFPFQPEAIEPLERAIKADTAGRASSRAACYLGNLLFDWQPSRAVELWERSISADPSFAIVHRNLAMAHTHTAGETGDVGRAISLLENAVSLPNKYPLHFAELDELYARAGKSPQSRLELLERNADIVSRRDDALSRLIGLKIFAGKLDEAIGLMRSRTFRVWEGGSLEVANQWADAHLLRGRQHLAAKRYDAALTDFETAGTIPGNLPSDTRQGGERDVELSYWKGVAYEAAGKTNDAIKAWERCSARIETDAPISERSAQVYYAALAGKRLGQDTKGAFAKLLASAERALSENTISARPTRRGPRRSSGARAATAHYIAGLGHSGLGADEAAKEQFRLALTSQPDQLHASFELKQRSGR